MRSAIDRASRSAATSRASLVRSASTVWPSVSAVELKLTARKPRSSSARVGRRVAKSPRARSCSARRARRSRYVKRIGDAIASQLSASSTAVSIATVVTVAEPLSRRAAG